MKANNALVILWNGSSLTDNITEQIARILVVNNVCTPEELTMKELDENEMARALAKSFVPTTVNVVDNTAEAIKNAVVYIGERFKDSLSSTNVIVGRVSFALQLQEAVNAARNAIALNGVGGTGNELLTAVEILSTKNGTIPQTLARKYRFNSDVIDIIKKVYNSFSY